MHSSRVVPNEEWLSRFHRAIHIIQCRRKKLVVSRFHPLLRQRSGIFAGLLAPGAKARISRRGIISRRGLALKHATRSVLRPEAGVFRIIDVFRLLLSV